MAKGYWIVNNVVNDAETYKSYQAANAAPLAEYGARFLVRAGTQQAREGQTFPRSVVIEFASYDDAIACYESKGYAAAKALRETAAEGSLIIVEGYDS
ncbi:MAG: DUF1330 domain-containing protein [Rhodobacteraceae bacterium]|nr:DUF1330 domain-containing protein [Paracoccaceae bacterium]